MTDLFLLGAGASVDAKIPDAYDMTESMLSKFSSDFRLLHLAKILQFVVGGLLFQQGIKGLNPFLGVNIEDLFNAIDLLGKRQDSELGPFISSWHPLLNGLEGGELSGFTGNSLLESIYDPIENTIAGVFRSLVQQPRPTSSRIKIESSTSSLRFQRLFVNAVRQIIIGGEGRLFAATADAMISKLVEMVWITDPSKIEYLIPLVKYANDHGSAIATLNYDNTIELCGSVTSIGIETGFEMWSHIGDFIINPPKIPLLKLHGSIDWALTDGETSKEKPLPYQIISKVDPNGEQQKRSRPAVVFGGKNKLTAKGPFLSLLRAFEQQLSNSDVVWAIGYSFRDEHINEFISNWFNGKPEGQLKIINPNPGSMELHFTRALLQGKGKDRVQLIAETAKEGISHLAV